MKQDRPTEPNRTAPAPPSGKPQRRGTVTAHAFLSLTCAIAATLLIFFFVYTVRGLSIFDYSPWASDAVNYLLQIRAAAAYGLDAGAFGIGEVGAALSASPYGVHGPVFPLLYGAILAPFPWSDAGPLIVNHVLFCGSLAFVLYRARADIRSTLIFVCFAATYWPVALMLSISMQEAVHGAFALTLAGLLLGPGLATTANRVAYLSLSTLAGIVRPLDAAMLPFGIARTRSSRVWLLVCMVAATFLLFFIFLILSASPNSLSILGLDTIRTEGRALGSFAASVHAAITNLSVNSANLVSLIQTYSVEGHLIVVTGIILIYLATSTLVAHHKKDKDKEYFVFCLWLVVATMVSYRVSGYAFFRMVGPLILFIAPVLLRDPRLTLTLIMINIIYLPAANVFVDRYRTPAIVSARDPEAKHAAPVFAQLKYTIGADRWNNCLSLAGPRSGELIFNALLDLPTGVGLQTVQLGTPRFRCRYALVSSVDVPNLEIRYEVVGRVAEYVMLDQGLRRQD